MPAMLGRSRWRLLTGDWRDVGVPEGCGAIVTDPPYGTRAKTGYRARGCNSEVWNQPPAWTSGMAVSQNIQIHGDDSLWDPNPILDLGLPSVIWGVDHWGSDYPIQERGRRGWGWIAWAKIDARLGRRSWRDDGGDIEFALLRPSRRRSVKIHVQMWKGLAKDSEGEDRISLDKSYGNRSRHPFQKPVLLMEWCISLLRLPPRTLLYDPYAGSGTVGVAALRTGHRYFGVEIDPTAADASSCN